MTGHLNTLWVVQVKHRLSDLWQPLLTAETSTAYLRRGDAEVAAAAMAETHPGWDYRVARVEAPAS